MYIRLIKSKNITLEDANKILEDEMKKKGFPSDEELKKEYEAYLKTEGAIEYAESFGHLKEFEDYKQEKLKEFSNKLYKEEQKPLKKWDYDDNWTETQEEAIE